MPTPAHKPTMMICPRCSANNDTGRAACWNCYAPLQGALASRVKPMLLTGRGNAVPAQIPETSSSDATGSYGVPEPPAPKKRGLFGRK